MNLLDVYNTICHCRASMSSLNLMLFDPICTATIHMIKYNGADLERFKAAITCSK